jgi:hypothetical protein
MKRTAKRSTVVGSVLALLLGAGVAFAAWTSTGLGSGTATATDAQDLGVAADSPTGLFPTGSVPVSVTVTNPNPYKIKLTSVEFIDATTTVVGCDAAVLSATDLTDLTDVIPADGGTVSKDIDVTMSNLAENLCQDAEFTVNFRATGSSTS